ncbi:hypothetical protein [Paludibacterium denitrificans]|uniref:Uncharacterized protein n=1 Tax=Paludibacterium denitrificans TaxID=2675226 RepID=A0A844GFG7_9NEIS|nr:hypothetical protein [Paludibacterium denitrificans]MTD34021.1 hypothetical protein [Paludibacterium denitrificans]
MDPIEQNDLPPDGEQDKPDESDSHKALIAAILLALLGFQRDYLLLYFPPEGNERPDLSPYAPSGPNGSPSRGPSSPNPHRPPSGQPSPHAPTLSTDSLKSDSQRIADWMAREISDTLQKRAAAAAAKARLDGLDEEGIKDAIKKVVESDALADVWANALATTLLGAASLDTAEQIGVGTMTGQRSEITACVTHTGKWMASSVRRARNSNHPAALRHCTRADSVTGARMRTADASSFRQTDSTMLHGTVSSKSALMQCQD